jgi:hypothetical protein
VNLGNREETVMTKTQPGRNGGTLKADAGPGRPKGSVSLVGALRQELTANPGKVKEIVAATIQAAIEGDTSARKLVFDRIDGLVEQGINLNVSGLTDTERADRILALFATRGEGGDRPADSDRPN